MTRSSCVALTKCRVSNLELPCFNRFDYLDSDRKCDDVVTHVNNNNNVVIPEVGDGGNNSNNNVSTSTTNKFLNVHHANVQSLMAHINELREIIQTLKSDIFAVSETWLNKSMATKNVKIDGYTFIRHDRDGRSKKRGGGVGIYIRSNLKYKIIEKSVITDQQGVEFIWLEVESQSGKILVGTVYRPPNITYGQLGALEDSLHVHSSQYSHIICLGDFNVDWQNDNPGKVFLKNITDLFNLTQVVPETTHITETSASLIDLAFLSQPEKLKNITQKSAPEISHHDILLLQYQTKKPKYAPKIIKTRQLKKLDCPDFKK